MEHKKIRQEVPGVDPEPSVGLTHEQVRQRMDAGWDNRTSRGAGLTEGQIVARHVLTFFNLIFALLAVILVLVRSSVTNFGFLGVVLVNMVIGVVQEIRAKRAVEKLNLVVRQTLKTVRGGKYVEVPSTELVRDDIVLLAGGNQVCADAVVREGSLQVNESLITGEPDAIEKQPGDELMAGSFVVAGRGAVQLIRVGDDSYAAKLSAEARRDPKAAKSRMMGELNKLIRVLSILLVPLGILYFVAEYTGGVSTAVAAEQTVAALVSMIPQGLYLLTSVALAASAIFLARKKVLVQDMNCIETLARTDVLCVDKTGTITEPGLQVEELISLSGAQPEYLEQLLGSLYGAEEPENDTAKALAEMYRCDVPWKCLRRIPFASEHKWSGAVFEKQGAFLTGAPEFILGDRYGEVAHLAKPWNRRGCRVLLCAGYEGDPRPGALDPERVTPLALIVLSGRIRREAPETFRFFEKQGVTVKVISGDDPETVSDIARRACIVGAENFISCERLRTEEDFADAVSRYTVFGRVTPEKKRSLVKALQAKKHTVAMTGDGVNDVLAMRQADCAVAVAGGAQAATQVAQLVLTTGDFSAIPHIVYEGRRVVGNIQRAAALFLVKNIFTVLLVVLSLLTPLVYPFQPIHLTVVMALTVGIPSFFFALEPNRERIRGAFLPGALRRALPGGMAAFVAVVLAQIVADAVMIFDTRLSTVCAAVLGVVGILVLASVCKPMTTLRKWVLAVMTALLLAAFLLPTKLLGLDIYNGRTAVLAILMCACAALLLLVFTFVMTGKKKTPRDGA